MRFLEHLTGRGSSRSAAPPKGLEDLQVVRCKTARRVALRVDPARGKICLVIPKRGSEKAAWRFADENRAWIIEHQSGLPQPVPFEDGAVLPVFGVNRTIRVTRTNTRTTNIKLNAHTLDVETSRDDVSANIKKFLYRTFEDTILPLVEEKSARVKRRVPSVRLRDTRARWGSCATDGRMMYCWRLIFAPPVVIDYVVAHECSHLIHMNHSERFWVLCDDLSEDMDYAREWLQINGDRILIYGQPR